MTTPHKTPPVDPADPFSAFPTERVKRALLVALGQQADVSVDNVANYWDGQNRAGFRMTVVIGPPGPLQRMVDVTAVAERQR